MSRNDAAAEKSPAPRNLPSLLSGLHAQRRSCTVSVTGRPGGTLHVRDGLVVAMETPGAPGAEAILLRSGRLTEEAWTAVRATDSTHEHLARELVAAGLIGAGELEVLCLGAVFDAAFALSLNRPVDWEVGDPVPVLHAGAGVPPERLVAETTRRFGMLEKEPGAIARSTRARVHPTPSAGLPESTARLSPRHLDLLSAVDGRRTPRDLAFSLGRGLFAVLLDLRHLTGLGLVEYAPPPGAAGRPSTAPRTPAAAPAAPATTGLPRRLPRRTGSQPDSPDSPGHLA
ncbi:DUF4388 domain-containing protein [Streptomyces sp. DSM 15324]|uniref:DUF4388 domain-containing protein n=1 Tax=Streptomyces sp. DSM 15324 TaxID=1739111 RepID=UPI0007460E74|nr:DUF4388 domain-containing protein [Streptomyces sp. DSM 15324]KUO09624.1 hypothetical protein AQJ58_24020 [Streptomyces sp. DSM 15324]